MTKNSKSPKSPPQPRSATALLYKSARDAWKTQAVTIAADGYFKDDTRAANYFDNVLAPLWRSRLNAPDSENLIKILRLTPTMLAILHLVGVAQHDTYNPGARQRRPKGCPIFDRWSPAIKTSPPGVTCYRAIPQIDLALMIDRRLDTVSESLRRFRGKGGVTEYHLSKLAVVLSIDAGIMIDGLFSAQLSFPFTREEFQHAREYALNQRQANGDVWTRQIEYTRQAERQAIGGMSGLVLLKTSPDDAQPAANQNKAAVGSER